MTDRDPDILFEEAAQWHAQIQSEQADWDGFALWLDADAAHQRAYEQIALIDDEVSRWASRHAFPATEPVKVEPVRPLGRRWGLVCGATAASLVAMICIPILMKPAASVYYTANDRQRVVALADGSSARLDRGTRLAIADGGKGAITIETGAAYFDVRHDPDRRLIVQAGDYVIRDIGTRFAVTRRGPQMSVAVEEGIVDVSWRGGAATMLKAGQKFAASGTEAVAQVQSVDPSTVASWRDGRLIYDDTPLSLVVADISRYTALPISVDPAAADLRLSGILLIEDGSHLVDQIEALLPVDSRREGDHIRLVLVRSRR